MSIRMKKWWPTNKWWTASTATLATLVGMFWVGDGVNTDSEKLIVISLFAQRAVAYIARNEPQAELEVPTTGRGR